MHTWYLNVTIPDFFLPTNFILPWRTNMGPIWGPYGSHMGPIWYTWRTIWVPYGSHVVYVGSHMGETRWLPDGPHGANGRWGPIWGIWAPSGPPVCPFGSHMGSPYGNHMVGEFCPDGNQMGPIFFCYPGYILYFKKTMSVYDLWHTGWTPKRLF